MHITRRSFIRTAGAAAAVLVSGGAFAGHGQDRSTSLFPLPPEIYSDPIFSYTAGQFEALIGTNFTVTLASGRTIVLTLTEVTPLEQQRNTLGGYYGESFSLIFETQQRLKLAQGSYRMTGEGMDLGSVLMVPTGRAQRQYEVVVNRITR